MSLGRVNTATRECEAAGYIDERAITDAGREALEPYRVTGAVIMAAGLSSRFAPISYERPKGTLKVRGEILVERQIRQLHEAGITNIALVVGYKKEYFFYLADKYGVDIVVNREYATRNNNGSLWRRQEPPRQHLRVLFGRLLHDQPLRALRLQGLLLRELRRGSHR